MTLLTLHRVLIVSFVAFALLFGVKMLRRYLEGSDASGLMGAIVGGLVAIGGIVYLVTAPHLRRK